ncbi:hypothetical protein [Devriesea agamarum]|uniref:hypothetical protein n=1 Tax=Devriesea agamarum TaxID=472569 RepID=UPI00071E02A8|nr:hypothetical protein [Devriesea agamarum]
MSNTHVANDTNILRSEPVISAATITAIVAALIALLIAFGIPISEDQKVAILGLVAVIAPIIVMVARKYVTPNSKVLEHVSDGEVIAGPANEAVPNGDVIRPVGSLTPKPDPEN